MINNYFIIKVLYENSFYQIYNGYCDLSNLEVKGFVDLDNVFFVILIILYFLIIEVQVYKLFISKYLFFKLIFLYYMYW